MVLIGRLGMQATVKPYRTVSYDFQTDFVHLPYSLPIAHLTGNLEQGMPSGNQDNDFC